MVDSLTRTIESVQTKGGGHLKWLKNGDQPYNVRVTMANLSGKRHVKHPIARKIGMIIY